MGLGEFEESMVNKTRRSICDEISKASMSGSFSEEMVMYSLLIQVSICKWLLV